MRNSHNDPLRPPVEDVAGYARHYNDAAFWKKIRTLPSSTVGTILEKALLCRELLLDGNTPFWVRGTLLGALGYLILPFDLVPDFVPVAGLVDDLAVLGMILANLDVLVTEEIRRRVQKKLLANPRLLSAADEN